MFLNYIITITVYVRWSTQLQFSIRRIPIFLLEVYTFRSWLIASRPL